MNGIEKITARILADAQAEADAVKAEADKQCAGIHDDYDKKAQEFIIDNVNAIINFK